MIPASCQIWPHELDTARTLAEDGRTVEFMPRTEGEKVKSADISMGGILWEMKAPEAAGADSLSRLLRRASKQSPNIVIDAARARHVTDAQFESSLRKAKDRVRAVRRLLLVRKNREVVDIK